jgi:carboxymethylenebutenolidase
VRSDRPVIAAPGGPLPAFLAAPDEWPPGSALIVIQEWWGLNDNITAIASRWAEEGFAALAPDLYRGELPSEPDEAKKLAMELDRPAALRDLRAAVAWLKGRGATSVGAMGFCMGGGIAWELALTDSGISAAVPCYGHVEFEGREVPIPVQGHYGTEDHFSHELLDAMRSKVHAAGGELHMYDGAGHAFMNDTRPAYQPEAAELAWSRAVGFLRGTLS